MKKILYLFVCLFVIGFSYSQPIFQFTGKVVKITDGDTIYISTGGKSFKVRLLGIDAPESYLYSIKNYKYYGCGISAKKLTTKYLSGKNLAFYFDDLAKQEDKYGRKLLYAWLGINPYGFIALNNGLASWYKWENFTFSGNYKQIDDENKILHKGMYNPFCVAQDEYIKANGKRSGGEIQTIIDQTLKSKTNFHYQLQNAKFNELKTLTGTIIFLDIDDANLTPEQIGQLKENGNILIGYVSIGEAEIFRDYWDNSWIDEDGNLTSNAPSWLDEKNPNWNSYKVKFWEDGWKNIVFSRIDKIKNAGYDGILMDVVDVYDYWQNQVDDSKKVADADDRMVSFVQEIREHLGDHLAIIPNQGFELVNKTGYLDLINGFLTESLYSENNQEKSEEDKNWQLQYLNKVKDVGKQVFDIDYINRNNKLICKYYDFIKEKGFLGAIYDLGLSSFNKKKCIVPEINLQKFGKLTQGTGPSYKYFYPVENAIDGDLSTYNHTSALNNENWLQVEIPGIKYISKISIWARQDYASRLENAKVYISNNPVNKENFSIEGKKLIGTLKGIKEEQNINLSPYGTGKYILIKAASGQNLHLAELKVYGFLQDAPIFKDYKRNILFPYSNANTGSILIQIQAQDGQGDNINYSLTGTDALKFEIDKAGTIILRNKLEAGKTYNFQVIASDGVNKSISDNIEVKITSKTPLQDALNSGKVDNITEAELIQAMLDYLNSKTDLTDIEQRAKELFTHFKNNDFNFTWKGCKNNTCKEIESLKLNEYGNIFRKLNSKKIDIFSQTGYTFEKLLILNGDKFKKLFKFPIDKKHIDDTKFVKILYSDYLNYIFRKNAPIPNDLGNFSKTDFSQVKRITKNVNFKTKKPFLPAGVYALPGETFKITRTDSNTGVTVKVFINSIRDGATHIYDKYGYTRPKYLQTTHIKINPGETIQLTSSYGGPIQLQFSKANENVSFKFENIAQHPFFDATKYDINTSEGEKKIQEVFDNYKTGKFNWVEIVTPGFVIHSRADLFEKYFESKEKFKQLIKDTIKYTSNYPLVLAGFKGSLIDEKDEIKSFAQEHNLEITFTEKVKHFNGDQATCGYGCSGNPYDAYWTFNPVGHGDLHEIGHGLEKSIFRPEGANYHMSTNPYSYYTKTQYYKQTGIDPTSQKLPFKETFEILKTSLTKTGSARIDYLKANIWDGKSWNKQFMFELQAFMIAQKMGKLKDGWLMLSRLHLLERNRTAIKNDWENRKGDIGFSNYSLDEFKNISNNDWLLVSYSFAVGLDFRDYFDLWGVETSQKAKEQVASFNYPKAPLLYFASSPDGYYKIDDYGDYLNKTPIKISKNAVYPEVKDDCPNGDYTYSKYDGGCGEIINGICGEANGQEFTNTPKENLCNSGIPTSISLRGDKYVWTCKGNILGVSKQCSANKKNVSSGGGGGGFIIGGGGLPVRGWGGINTGGADFGVHDNRIKKDLQDKKISKEVKIKKIERKLKLVIQEIKKYLGKNGTLTNDIKKKIKKIIETIRKYKLGKITKKQAKQEIKKFLQEYKKIQEKKKIADKIKKLKFKLNTNHKYPKYEKMFENFFNKKKKIILQNSKYWNEDYYNYLNSFIVYSEWLFVDIENRNIQNIYSYVDSFKKMVRKLKNIK